MWPDSPEIQAALIQAIGTVVAAAFGVVIWALSARLAQSRDRREHQLELDGEAKRRDQRILDLVTAIHSEIVAGLCAAGDQLTPDEIAYAIQQDTPFATPDDTDFVFETLQEDITILPESVIHSVVQYYRITRQSNLLTADLRHPQFLAQTAPEKEKFLSGLLSVVELQKHWADAAVEDLEEFAADRGMDLAKRRKTAQKLFTDARQTIAEAFRQSDELDQLS